MHHAQLGGAYSRLGLVRRFGIAVGVRWASEKQGWPLYDPDTLIQGRAIWHVLAALTVLVLFGFLRTEEKAA